MRLEGPIDLPHTLQGGQAFRWARGDDGAYRGVLGDSLVEMRAGAGGSVEAEGLPERALRAYLRLEPADAARRKRLRKDPTLAPAMRATPGLRLLRQDPWETTVAFLTSANNNVLRIEGIMRGLAQRYGEPVCGAEGFHAFPSPARLARASEDALRACGLGYRAPFLRETSRLVARGAVDLGSLRGASHEEAREGLLQLPGVGPKVADCIALFSLDVDDAFPIDRWVLRAVEDAFGPMDMKAAASFARERWGRDAGLAQQYLFHALRMREGAPGTKRAAPAP